MKASQYFIRRLGLYKNITSGTISFINITFRMIGGVLNLLPLEAVSFFTFIERMVWLFMEVPGGWLADRWGRLKTAILGYILIAFGNLSLYLAYLAHSQHGVISPFVYLCMMGLCVGVGGPFVSASVEAYYQEMLESALKKEGLSKKEAVNSFSVSTQFGKFLPMVYVVFAFACLYALYHSIGAAYAILIFIALELGLILFLLKDYFQYGDPSFKDRHTLSFREVFSLLAKDKNLRLTSSVTAICWLIVYISGYYALLSLGRNQGLDQSQHQWWPLLFLVLSIQGITPSLRGYILPYLVQRFKPKTNILGAFAFSLIAAAAAYVLMTSVVGQWGYISLIFIVYAVVIDILIRHVFLLMQNQALQQASKHDYATVLSINIMPAQVGVFVYSLILSLYFQGAPSVQENSMHVMALCLLALLLYAYARGKK